MIVARTFGRRRVLGIYCSETLRWVQWVSVSNRAPEGNWLDVAQLHHIAATHDRRKRRTGWEPPPLLAVPLYLLVGLAVRMREGRR